MSVESAPVSHQDAQAPAHAALLGEAEAKRLLRAAGIRVPRGVVVEDIALVGRTLGEPLVLKAVSPTLVHKSDAGGVRVGLRHDDLVAAAARMRAEVRAAGHDLTGYLVEEMSPRGEEVVVGAVRTPGVGWAVMLGLGGVFVEVLADVAFGVAPLARHDIEEMLAELRGAALLTGARGRPALDVPALVDLVERLAGPDGLLATLPDDIVEVDLNPVIVGRTGAVAVDARFVRGRSHATVAVPAPAPPTDFTRLFAPATVAVLGAKSAGTNGANLFIRNLRAGGFTGRIIPVHPEAAEIERLPAVASLAEVEGIVDYAYVVLPADRVSDALALGGGRVRFAQVISSGFAEVAEGIEREHELVARMRALGTRVIGPNCLGTHTSAGRLSFVPDPPFEPGRVAVVSQSGGLSVDILRVGAAAGLAFHSVVSLGNSADVTAAELVRDHLARPEVKVIGLYLESLAAAGGVLEVLRQAETTKPVVLLAGGRTQDGSRAATSHTGALAGNHRLWPALARQAGAILVDSLEEFVHVLLALDVADPTTVVDGVDIVLFGNGGGASVLAADALQRRGLATPRLSAAAVARLDGLGLPPGNGLSNPIDVPAGTLAVKGGAVTEDILTTVLESAAPAVVITHLNVGIIQRNLGETLGDVTGRIIDSVARVRAAAPHRCHHFLVLKTDGKPDVEEMIRDYTRRARALDLACFPTFEAAAVAASGLLTHQRRIAAARGRSGSPTETEK